MTDVTQDVSNAVAKLDGVLLFVALLAIAFVALLVFERSNTVTSLVPLATLVLGFSFIFGHSAQTLFESASFIFTPASLFATRLTCAGPTLAAHLHFLHTCL